MPTLTDMKDNIHPECCECNATQCNVMLTNTAVEYMLCIQKHQYERYLTHKIVMGDTFPLQELVKVSSGMERTQT